MKKQIRIFTLMALAATFCLPAVADYQPATAAAVQDGQSDADAKAALYKRFTDNFQKPDPAAQKIAYDAGKEYLQKYGGDTSRDNVQIVNYIKSWVSKYEAAASNAEFYPLIYQKKNYPAAFAKGKQLLASDPDNLKVLINLAYAGYLASTAKDDTNDADAINYGKQALQLIDAGKTPEDWQPFSGKDEALAYLNFTIGELLMKSSPTEAVPYFIKATQYDAPVRKTPVPYLRLAKVYTDTQYTPMATDYKQYIGKEPSDAQKNALANLNGVMDRIIDAYARAVAYSSDPKYQQAKPDIMKTLTEFYKARNNDSTAGLDQLIASVTQKPLPEPFVPSAAPTPSPTPTPTPTTSGQPPSDSSGAAASSTTGTGAASSTAKPASPSAKPPKP